MPPGFRRMCRLEFRDSIQEKSFYSLNYFQAGMRLRKPTASAKKLSLKQWIINSGALLGIGTDNGVPMTFHADALLAALAKL